MNLDGGSAGLDPLLRKNVRCDAMNFSAVHAKPVVSTRDESTEAFQEAHLLVFCSAAPDEYQSVERVANAHEGPLDGLLRKEGAANVCSSVPEITVVSRTSRKSSDFQFFSKWNLLAIQS